jgi:hypothetical protein
LAILGFFRGSQVRKKAIFPAFECAFFPDMLHEHSSQVSARFRRELAFLGFNGTHSATLRTRFGDVTIFDAFLQSGHSEDQLLDVIVQNVLEEWIFSVSSFA